MGWRCRRSGEDDTKQICGGECTRGAGDSGEVGGEDSVANPIKI